MQYLFIINDAPYGSEKAYNAFRLAMQIKKDYPENEIRVFLMADAATCALPFQNTPQGYYNIERMLKSLINKGGKVKICGTCAEARGIKDLQLIDGAELSNMAELSNWTIQADKVLVF
jgi:uncharacterized protein involved in oxidation of intracellular sulfur